MLQYLCDWCKRSKEPQEDWVLGFAAETVGVTMSRSEISVASKWDDARAVHPLAVHFCSAAHKDNYVQALVEKASDTGASFEQIRLAAAPPSPPKPARAATSGRRSSARKRTKRRA